MKKNLQVLLLLAAVSYAPSMLRAQTAALKATAKDDGVQTNKAPQHNNIQINSGVIVLNAFEAGPLGTNGAGTKFRELKSSSNRARFFVDFGFNYVWAWDYTRRAKLIDNWASADNKLATDVQKIWGLFEYPDFQGHLSYYAGGKDQATVSAILGSGEFGMEITMGLPFYQAVYYTSDPAKKTAVEKYGITASAHWLGPVISYGGATDTQNFDLHERIFVGFGYRMAYRIESINRDACLSFQVGYANIEQVRFLSHDNKQIEIEHGDVPVFHHKSCFALEAEVAYPITDSLNVALGSRIYAGLEPNAWSAYIALTIPAAKLGDIFK